MYIMNTYHHEHRSHIHICLMFLELSRTVHLQQPEKVEHVECTHYNITCKIHKCHHQMLKYYVILCNNVHVIPKSKTLTLRGPNVRNSNEYCCFDNFICMYQDFSFWKGGGGGNELFFCLYISFRGINGQTRLTISGRSKKLPENYPGRHKSSGQKRNT